MSLYPASPTVKMEPSSLPAIIKDALAHSRKVMAQDAAFMSPSDMMTPESWAEDNHVSNPCSPSTNLDYQPESTPPPSGEKKTKKRKSWGQVLPEPKTNLPPRKRAKTEDEKEQRRVERVLRNRRAAQSSRERKRLEVEALEQRNKQLENLLVAMQEKNSLLVEELSRLRRAGVSTCPSPRDPLRDTLSQQLFGSSDGYQPSKQPPDSLVDDMIMSNPAPTVNPASISPERTPILKDSAYTPARPSAEPDNAQGAISSDLTQHPAEMLPWDLPCHTPEETPRFLQTSPTLPTRALTAHMRLLLLSASTIVSICQRPLVQIALSLKAGFSLHPTPQVLTMIIWLTTVCPIRRQTQHSSYSTLVTSFMTKQPTRFQAFFREATRSLSTTALAHRPLTLRFRFLKKILASSPDLARPLLDATMVALRLGSNKTCHDQLGNCGFESLATHGRVAQLVQCLKGVEMPSQKVLLTLAWVLKVAQRRNRVHKGHVLSSSLMGKRLDEPSAHSCTTSVGGFKRKAQESDHGSRKRNRLM